jgi:hypothetical protein
MRKYCTDAQLRKIGRLFAIYGFGGYREYRCTAYGRGARSQELPDAFIRIDAFDARDM